MMVDDWGAVRSEIYYGQRLYAFPVRPRIPPKVPQLVHTIRGPKPRRNTECPRPPPVSNCMVRLLIISSAKNGAVLRLTTNSNLVGNWMGSSLGFSPRRMRST
jgi:hypothetical protein